MAVWGGSVVEEKNKDGGNLESGNGWANFQQCLGFMEWTVGFLVACLAWRDMLLVPLLFWPTKGKWSHNHYLTYLELEIQKTVKIEKKSLVSNWKHF